ncbi:TonB-dependent siderophore receptor [Alcanivorax sp.]|uniref:TonB-dependent siderophore receptor n=1 Tax=Alcanivorax sp. TaxID=1872427 RepID=UPI003A953789
MGACLLSLIPLAVQAEETSEANVIPAVEVNADAEEGASYITEQQAAKTGKLDVAVEDTPFAISVVNEEFIRDTGAKNIQDALMYSSGVYAGAFGFDTRGDWAKVRGMDPSFYLDGLRSVYGSYNSVRTNVYALEQLEVLKGPSSVLYGQSELGGIINSVSKLPKPEQQGELWAQVGSFDRKQLAADVTGPLSKDGKLLYRLVALKRDSGTQVDYVDDDGFLFAPSITWLATDNTTISLLFNAQENSGGVSAQFLPAEGTIDPGVRGDVPSETFVGEPDWDRYDREKNEVTLFVDHRLNEAWSLAATGRYTSSSSETREHWAAIGAGVAANGDTLRTIYMADNDTEVTNFDIRLEGDVDLGTTRHRLAVGVDRQDALWEQGNYFYGYGQGGTINLYNPVYGTVNYAALNPADRPDNEIK